MKKVSLLMSTLALIALVACNNTEEVMAEEVMAQAVMT